MHTTNSTDKREINGLANQSQEKGAEDIERRKQKDSPFVTEREREKEIKRKRKEKEKGSRGPAGSSLLAGNENLGNGQRTKGGRGSSSSSSSSFLHKGTKVHLPRGSLEPGARIRKRDTRKERERVRGEIIRKNGISIR